MRYVQRRRTGPQKGENRNILQKATKPKKGEIEQAEGLGSSREEQAWMPWEPSLEGLPLRFLCHLL
jgi:hypothetical protein